MRGVVGFAILGGVGWMFEFLGLAGGFGLPVVGFRVSCVFAIWVLQYWL